MPEIPENYGDVALHFRTTGDAEDMLVTFGGLFSSTPDAASCVAIGDAWAEHIAPQWSDSLTLVLVRISFNDGGADPIVVEAAMSWPGSVGGAVCPPNTAVLVRKVTALGGRKHRGRFFHPGVVVSALSDAGEIDGGQLATWQTAFDDFKEAIELAGDHEAMNSMQLLHEDATAPDLITSLIVQPKVATQRRRLRPS